MLLRAILAGAVALLVVLGAACLATPPSPTPEVPFSPEDRASPQASESESSGQHERVRVVGAGAEGVNLRAGPGTSSPRLKRLVDGTEFELVGPDSTAQGRPWGNVRDPFDGTEGWVAAEFLAPVAAPSAPSPWPGPSR